MSPSCTPTYHTHPPRCPCGTPVTRDQMTRTASGAVLFWCAACSAKARRTAGKDVRA